MSVLPESSISSGSSKDYGPFISQYRGVHPSGKIIAGKHDARNPFRAVDSRRNGPLATHQAQHRLCVGRNKKNPECSTQWHGPIRPHRHPTLAQRLFDLPGRLAYINTPSDGSTDADRCVLSDYQRSWRTSNSTCDGKAAVATEF